MIRPTGTCCDSCAHGGPCAGAVAPQLGDVGDIQGFLTGLSTHIIISGAAVILYLLLAGPGARARREALGQENERHRKAIARIKRDNRRL